jgi:hypothetical protein
MGGSGEVVVGRHAAPNGAWLPAWNMAINMALLTELTGLLTSTNVQALRPQLTAMSDTLAP